MKSTKGALFHWIGIVVIFALAFAVLAPVEFGVKPKGTWQLEFLQSFVEAEKQLADTDQLALQAGRKTALSLAGKGGFATMPSCGSADGITYWNKGKDFCFLSAVDESISTEFNSLYKEYDKSAHFTLSRQGKELVGKTDKEIVFGQKDAQYYAFTPGFRVNLDYNFDEYFLLQDEAKKLVDECKSAQNLQDCLEKVRPSYWKFSSCEDERFTEKERKIVFCVESPNKYSVFENGKFVPVQYKLGLDFGVN